MTATTMKGSVLFLVLSTLFATLVIHSAAAFQALSSIRPSFKRQQRLQQAPGSARHRHLFSGTRRRARAALSTRPESCYTRERSTTRLGMGLLDVVGNFLGNREGDFVPLKDSADAFGPGPLLVLYQVPPGILDDEVRDILDDALDPQIVKQCRFYRITQNDDNEDNNLLNLPLEQALESMIASQPPVTSAQPSLTPTLAGGMNFDADDEQTLTPVLFFSGFRNAEMMAVYNVLGREIYQETAGRSSPACAKAVPNAMAKPLYQVLEEIAGDHEEALSNSNNKANDNTESASSDDA